MLYTLKIKLSFDLGNKESKCHLSFFRLCLNTVFRSLKLQIKILTQ